MTIKRDFMTCSIFIAKWQMMTANSHFGLDTMMLKKSRQNISQAQRAHVKRRENE